MFRSMVSLLVFPALVPTSLVAQAFDQNHFMSLLTEYQSVCSRMLASPMDFHNDPRGSFAVTGEEDIYITDNLSSVDYYVETPLGNRPGNRSYGVVSVQIANLLEQSCQVIDYKPDSSSDAELLDLANTMRAIFGSSPDFEISGGKRGRDDPSDYFFAVTGLFLGVDVISQISFGQNVLSIEHIHFSKLAE